MTRAKKATKTAAAPAAGDDQAGAAQAVDPVQATLTERLRAELIGLLVGAGEDIERAAAEIGARATTAALAGRQDLVDECVMQVRLVLERNRLRVNHAGLAAVHSAVRMAGHLVGDFVRAGLLRAT